MSIHDDDVHWALDNTIKRDDENFLGEKTVRLGCEDLSITLAVASEFQRERMNTN
jgi:hypothetical protein